jgi:protocatechuate 3,4-dioxygenase beta subunit
MLVKGRVLDQQGKPVAGCVIETWETVSRELA